MPWLTADDLTARLPDFDPAVSAQVSAVEALIAEAEAFIQAETGRTFVDPSGTPSARVVYGSGTPYLAVDAHAGTIGADDIAIASGAAVPSFVDRGTYLVITDSTGDISEWSRWPAGDRITVTADYGEAAPADLLTAARDLVAAWYTASLSDDAAGAVPDVPPTAARVIARHRLTGAMRRMFA